MMIAGKKAGKLFDIFGKEERLKGHSSDKINLNKIPFKFEVYTFQDIESKADERCSSKP